MMMTADCLPIVLGNADGTEIANLHAGWRGLAGGIIENTITEMKSQPTWAWMGAAISQPCFEIGARSKNGFLYKYPELETAFKAGEQDGKFYADLYAIARYILNLQKTLQWYWVAISALMGKIKTFIHIAVMPRQGVWQHSSLCNN